MAFCFDSIQSKKDPFSQQHSPNQEEPVYAQRHMILPEMRNPKSKQYARKHPPKIRGSANKLPHRAHNLFLAPLHTHSPEFRNQIAPIKLQHDSPLKIRRQLPEFNELLRLNPESRSRQKSAFTMRVDEQLVQQRMVAHNNNAAIREEGASSPLPPRIEQLREREFSMQQRLFKHANLDNGKAQEKPSRSIHRRYPPKLSAEEINESRNYFQSQQSAKINEALRTVKLVQQDHIRSPKLRHYPGIEKTFPSIENRKAIPPEAPAIAPTKARDTKNSNVSDLMLDELRLT